MTTTPETQGLTCPIAHPFDQGADGINRPGLYKSRTYDKVRETGTGVVDIERANGTAAKIVTRYHDVVRVLRDQRTFSRQAALDVDDVEIGDTLLGLDGDDHAAVRNVVKDWFTPAAVEERRPEIEARATAQLDVMLSRGEPADLVETFAMPLTLDTIGDILGLPHQDRPQFHRWSEVFLANNTLTRADTESATTAMAGYLAGLIEQRGRQPEGDLLSQIAAAGASLPPQRIIMLPIALIVGGWETATASIGTFVQVLLTHSYEDHKSAYEYLVDNPHMVAGAVNELERMFSNSAADEMPRRVTQDVTLPSGAFLRAGEVVIPSHDAANFDPRVFDDPHEMNFARTGKHLSFGHGAHHCIGRHLGHVEVVMAVELLVRRLPGLRMAISPDRVEYKVGNAISGPVRLPVAWTPSSPSAPSTG
ncbi:cytochrome P450 [Streptosporangium sp. DT93]|uniref:cytochrome P450 n=1 Tax=Streptosporangium sp. DT93 TaxID=3393428 RepID=UPI003CED23BB